MADPFATPKHRVASSRQHIAQLEVLCEDYVRGRPAKLIVERDGKTGHDLHKVVLRDLPEDLVAAARKAVEDLRSALDQAGNAAAVYAGKAAPRHSYFPIADSREGLKGVGQSKCKDLPAAVLDQFLAFHPYRGGNDLIWGLNKMANTAKHTILAPVALWTAGAAIGNMSYPPGSCISLFMPPTWDRAKDAMIFGEFRAGTRVKHDLRLFVYVGIGDIGELYGAPAAELITEMADEVDRVIRGAQRVLEEQGTRPRT